MRSMGVFPKDREARYRAALMKGAASQGEGVTTDGLDLAERRRAFGRALRVTGALDAAPLREYVAQHVPEAPTGVGTVPAPRPEAGREADEHSMKRQR